MIVVGVQQRSSGCWARLIEWLGLPVPLDRDPDPDHLLALHGRRTHYHQRCGGGFASGPSLKGSMHPGIEVFWPVPSVADSRSECLGTFRAGVGPQIRCRRVVEAGELGIKRNSAIL